MSKETDEEKRARGFSVFLDGPEAHGIDVPKTITGEQRAVTIARTYLWTKLQWVVLALVSSGGFAGIWKGWDKLSMFNEANAQQKVVVENTKVRLDAHLIQDAEDKREYRRDMKALYDAVVNKKKSKRLEKIDAGTEEE